MAVSGILSSSQITSLIQQATAANQLPAGVLQAQEKPLQAQVAALTQVQSALSGLQSALSGLANIQTLAQRTVTVSPNNAIKATADNTASAGTLFADGDPPGGGGEPDLVGLGQRQRHIRRRDSVDPGRQRLRGQRRHRQRPVEPRRYRHRDRQGQCRGTGVGGVRRVQISPRGDRRRDGGRQCVHDQRRRRAGRVQLYERRLCPRRWSRARPMHPSRSTV